MNTIPHSEIATRGEIYGRSIYGELCCYNEQRGWVLMPCGSRAWVQARKELIRVRLARRPANARTWEARSVAIGNAGGEIPRIIEGRVRRIAFS